MFDNLANTNFVSSLFAMEPKRYDMTYNGGVTRPCARARQAKRVLTQGRRGIQGRTGASGDK